MKTLIHEFYILLHRNILLSIISNVILIPQYLRKRITNKVFLPSKYYIVKDTLLGLSDSPLGTKHSFFPQLEVLTPESSKVSFSPVTILTKVASSLELHPLLGKALIQ